MTGPGAGRKGGRQASDIGPAPPSAAAALRCVVGDRSVVFAEGLVSVLESGGEITVVGRARRPEELAVLARALAPDVAVVGFDPPEAFDAVRAVPGVPAVVLSWSRRHDDLFEAVLAGAAGLVAKDAPPEHLVTALEQVAAGGLAFPDGWERRLVERLGGEGRAGRALDDRVVLTRREREVVQLVVDGCSNKEVARALGIAHQTAKNHLRHLMAKARVTSRTQLCLWALHRGWASSRLPAAGP